jgi:hypothetical protein
MKIDNKTLQRKIGKEPVFIYSDFEECAIRAEKVDGEIVYYLKFKGNHEFKAIYNSRLVGDALSSNPEFITKEEYNRY